MAICRVQYGITLACGDLIFPGGVYPDFYVGYTRDMSIPHSIAQTGFISTMTFIAYRGLIKFEGQKYAHKADWVWQKGAGGNGFWLHRFAAKLTSLSTQDDVEIQRLAQAQDAFVVWRNNNQQFMISGAINGLASMPGDVGSSGLAAADEITDTIILEGAEATKPLRFLNGADAASTFTYLEARIV